MIKQRIRVARMVNHGLPGWEAWLGITSNNEPLEVGEGGSFMMK